MTTNTHITELDILNARIAELTAARAFAARLYGEGALDVLRFDWQIGTLIGKRDRLEARLAHPLITPEEQIEGQRALVSYLHTRRRRKGGAAALRVAEQDLVRMEAAHARGELAPLVNDGCPF